MSSRWSKPALPSPEAARAFAGRGFSSDTIGVLAKAGITHPEQLLFLPDHALARLPVSPKAHNAEVVPYIRRFRAGFKLVGRTAVHAVEQPVDSSWVVQPR